MRIINYDYGYNNTFNCSIHGKIIVTRQEWQIIIRYLFHPRVKSYYLYKDVLKQDLERSILTPKGRLFNIRVTATDLAVKKLGGIGYKTGNYTFLVLHERS